jgi:hypothetical protein
VAYPFLVSSTTHCNVTITKFMVKELNRIHAKLIGSMSWVSLNVEMIEWKVTGRTSPSTPAQRLSRTKKNH